MNSKNPKKILVVDDEPDMRWILTNVLRKSGYEVITADNGKDAIDKVEKYKPILTLLDIRMPHLNGIQVLKKVKNINYSMPVVMITAYGDVKSAIQSMKLGAYDYITKPFDNDELLLVINRALEKLDLEKEVVHLRSMLKGKIDLYKKMGKSTAIEELSEKVKKVASSDFSVLIQGESGAGKELVAEAIHLNSARSGGPFVVVDCGAIPETLIESELFGFEKGAFTGALKRKEGYFETADKGTLFLDEIINLPKSVQMKLLRAIWNKKIRHLGGLESIQVDVRIICASNKDVFQQVNKGEFRSDLYYRINEFKIDIPPLRERKDDILYLANIFLKEVAEELDKEIKVFSKEAKRFLLNHEWPGNVRELKNVVRRSALVANEIVTTDDFPDELKNLELSHGSVNQIDSIVIHGLSWKELKKSHQRQFEEQIIGKVLKQTNGNKSKAAKILKMDYKTFHTKVKELSLNKNQLNK